MKLDTKQNKFGHICLIADFLSSDI